MILWQPEVECGIAMCIALCRDGTASGVAAGYDGARYAGAAWTRAASGHDARRPAFAALWHAMICLRPCCEGCSRLLRASTAAVGREKLCAQGMQCRASGSKVVLSVQVQSGFREIPLCCRFLSGIQTRSEFWILNNELRQWWHIGTPLTGEIDPRSPHAIGTKGEHRLYATVLQYPHTHHCNQSLTDL